MIDIKHVGSKSLWYIIGYIVTDGNLSKDRRHISITSKDIDHLYKIRSALNQTISVRRKMGSHSKEKIYGELGFSDVNFYRYLQSVNIGPRKSLVQGAVLINQKYFSDFLRGVIDGDGCIHSWKNKDNSMTQWCVRITSASKEFAHWLFRTINNEYSINGKIYCQKYENRNPIYIIKFGKIAGQVILKNIYYKDCLCLDRKRAIVEACLLDQSKMVNYGSVIIARVAKR